MQQAIERVTRSIEAYREGGLSRSLAKIELVSAFKVVSKTLSVSAEELHGTVGNYIEALLTQLDEGTLSTTQAVAELARVYEAAHNDDPQILGYMARF